MENDKKEKNLKKRERGRGTRYPANAFPVHSMCYARYSQADEATTPDGLSG